MTRAVELHLGTSGFSYPAWKGRFYPKNLKPADMLSFYATQFGAVEINASFYRMPTESMLTGWVSQVPGHFRFALKAPQRITHQLRLSGVDATVTHFIEVAKSLGARLGPLLFQLPPNFPKDLAKLAAFLELLPRGQPVSFEFRHASWFEADTLSLLRSHGVALCWEQADELESPFVSTAEFGYLRLRRLDYSDAQLNEWAARIQAQDWRAAYVFFKHEDEARGPAFAVRFRKLWDG